MVWPDSGDVARGGVCGRVTVGPTSSDSPHLADDGPALCTLSLPCHGQLYPPNPIACCV